MTGVLVVITAAVLQVDSAEIVSTAQGYVGRPYVYGGEGPSGVDCSGLVLAVFNQHGLALPRTALDQSRVGQRVPVTGIVPGDLLFFTHTPGSARVQHVGVAVDERHMIHASTSRRVVVVDAFDSRYYRDRFLFARRVIGEPPAPAPEVAASAPAKVRAGSAEPGRKGVASRATRKKAATRPKANAVTGGVKAASSKARAKAVATETSRSPGPARSAAAPHTKTAAGKIAKPAPKAGRAKRPCPAGQDCARAAATRSASDTRK